MQLLSVSPASSDCLLESCLRPSATAHCSYFQGFGRENPSKVRLREKEKEAEQEGEENSGSSDGKELRRDQSATERDKEEKDKWRSWKAKLGLVSA